MSISFKVFFEGEARRFKIVERQYAHLQNKLEKIFPNENLTLKWKDSDGDMVTIACDDDLVEALNCMYLEHKIAYNNQGNVGNPPPPSAYKIHAFRNPNPESPESVTDDVKSPVPKVTPKPVPPIIVPVVHPNVTCDVSGEEPLTGTRYKKIDSNYDLNEIEFSKLSPSQQTNYVAILRPGAFKIPIEPIVHYHYTCDESGVSPIVGLRFHKIGENFDLCVSEFAKLSEEEKRKYEIFNHPRATAIPYHGDVDPVEEADSKSKFESMVSEAMRMFPNHEVESASWGKETWRPFWNPTSGVSAKPKFSFSGHGRRGTSGSGCWKDRVECGDILPTDECKFGSFGPGVEQLQLFLINKGLMDEYPNKCHKNKGYYYAKRIENAIRSFQDSRKLNVKNKGEYCNITRNALLDLIKEESKVSENGSDLESNSDNDDLLFNGDPLKRNEPRVAEQPIQLPQAQVMRPDEVNNFVMIDSKDTKKGIDEDLAKKWAPQLEQLKAMGFENAGNTGASNLLEILEKVQGDVDNAVAQLVEN